MHPALADTVHQVVEARRAVVDAESAVAAAEQSLTAARAHRDRAADELGTAEAHLEAALSSAARSTPDTAAEDT